MWEWLNSTLGDELVGDVEMWYNDGVFIVSTLFEWSINGSYYSLVGCKYIISTLWQYYQQQQETKKIRKK